MAIRTYTKATQLSPHFNSTEFMCKCGCKRMKVDDRLISMLENIFDKANAKSIIVVSGYRCPSYDKKIGGFAGKHSEGKAADVQVIGKDGNKISTKKISCIAQDLFKEGGIANINKTYTNIHIDSRTGSRWLGNECVSNSTVTKDFYSYYNLKKSDVYPSDKSTVSGSKPDIEYTVADTKFKVIDVSKHQGKIDWPKVKASGINVAIIRCGYGDDIPKQDDECFEYNYNEAIKNGIKVGIYLYSYAASVSQAVSEANHVIRLIKGKQIDYPVYYDLEDAKTTGKCSVKLIGDIAENFCNVIKSHGFKIGIYANTNWFNNKLTDSRFKNYDKWVAQYSTSCTYKGDYQAWQYTDKAKIDGIKGNVDCSYFYKDYAIENLKYTNITNPEVVYCVKSGDTLGAIANKYHKTISELAKKNNITDVNKIYIGQKIKI